MSASTGWIRTARTVLPRLLVLSRETHPTWWLDSAAQIDDGFLEAEGISGLVWDVDGTLTAHHAREVHASVRARFDALRVAPGLRHAIVSNCQLPRFVELGELFPDMPVILGFSTDEGIAFRVRSRGTEAFTGPGAKALEAGEASTPIRKPNADLVGEALRQMGMSDAPEAAVMIGDQYFTDIVSANLAGIRSLKVRTIDPPSFPTPVRLSQKLERGWVGGLRGLGLVRRHG
ncbi:MAG: HAD hydrolase-like protein [Gemmatimonadota bacterium]|nr:HAD hydrolase-like protein [Gemmatimonadota bacterium]